MAEQADAQDLKSCVLLDVQVQILVGVSDRRSEPIRATFPKLPLSKIMQNVTSTPS